MVSYYFSNVLDNYIWVIPEFILAVVISAAGITFLYREKAKLYTFAGYVLTLSFTALTISFYMQSTRYSLSGYCVLLAVTASIPCLKSLAQQGRIEDLPLRGIMLPAFIGPFLLVYLLASLGILPDVIGPRQYSVLTSRSVLHHLQLLPLLLIWYPRCVILSMCMNLWLVSLPEKHSRLTFALGFSAPLLVSLLFLFMVRYTVFTSTYKVVPEIIY